MLKRHFLLRPIKTQVQLAGLSSTQGSPKAPNPCYCVCRNTEKRPGGAGESRMGEHPLPALPPQFLCPQPPPPPPAPGFSDFSLLGRRRPLRDISHSSLGPHRLFHL